MPLGWPLCNCLCLCFLEKALPSIAAVQSVIPSVAVVIFSQKRPKNYINRPFCVIIAEKSRENVHSYFRERSRGSFRGHTRNIRKGIKCAKKRTPAGILPQSTTNKTSAFRLVLHHLNAREHVAHSLCELVELVPAAYITAKKDLAALIPEVEQVILVGSASGELEM